LVFLALVFLDRRYPFPEGFPPEAGPAARLLYQQFGCASGFGSGLLAEDVQNLLGSRLYSAYERFLGRFALEVDLVGLRRHLPAQLG
jgi:hypothetical protein